tara:strand:- start:231 stop:416 length:186 start_codon:yes stop_codon:yes gene_type:complete
MTKGERSHIRSKLYAQSNVQDMLNVLISSYDLSKPTNAITQAMIAEQLLKGIELINPDPLD